MATLFARHEVSDFDTWKKAYDDFDSERSAMGVTAQGVYQADENPNDVTVYHTFSSLEQAKVFASSTRLREVMSVAGVVGTPDVWITTQA